jgi:hypothetical protein
VAKLYVLQFFSANGQPARLCAGIRRGELLNSSFNLFAASSFFLETQRVSGAELSELLIKHGLGVTTGGLM